MGEIDLLSGGHLTFMRVVHVAVVRIFLDGHFGGETTAREEDSGDGDVGDDDRRVLERTDLLAVHEPEEGEHAAGCCEPRSFGEVAVDDEGGDRAEHDTGK